MFSFLEIHLQQGQKPGGLLGQRNYKRTLCFTPVLYNSLQTAQQLSRTGNHQRCTLSCRLQSRRPPQLSPPIADSSFNARYFIRRKKKKNRTTARHRRCRNLKHREGTEKKLFCFVGKTKNQKNNTTQMWSPSCGTHSNQDHTDLIALPPPFQTSHKAHSLGLFIYFFLTPSPPNIHCASLSDIRAKYP